MARRGAITLLIFFLLIPGVLPAAEMMLRNTPVQIYFSPQGECTRAIVREISAARAEILVQAYSFTSAPIAKSLLDAHKRGIKITAILDKSQRREKYTSATFLSNSGIPVLIDSAHAIAHNKIIIIDRETVITGSFNFTKAAEEKNAENLLIIRSRELAAKFVANWNEHRMHSEPFDKDF
jgi:phosphatidylserine/phosphatidylglycerophosphate/cardiolipin synthase-like enzyme